MNPIGPIARRFPLVARPRPPCTPLDLRISQLFALANEADQTGDMGKASAVHNQAALLASDCGLPDLARQWCHRHAVTYLNALPLNAPDARRALEPVVNLARLHIRDGNGDTAFQILDKLYKAVTTCTDIVIDELPVPASMLTSTSDDHQQLRQWLWTVHLADGTRALTSTGRWHDAHAHLQRHKGIGQRMLDGRQVTVIALTAKGDLDNALALLTYTTPGELWETAVTTCLTMLCRQLANHSAERDLALMLDLYRQLDPTPQLAVFDTRLGLSAIEAARGVEHPTAQEICVELVRRTTTSHDGYAARDLLEYNSCTGLLTERQKQDLAKLVDACGLGRQTIPPELRADLSGALATSEAVLTNTLTDSPNLSTLHGDPIVGRNKVPTNKTPRCG